MGKERSYQKCSSTTPLEEVILKLRRIDTVVNGVAETAKDWHEVTSKMVFEQEYVDALLVLDQLKRIWVMFGFHRHRGWTPRVRPRHAKDESLVGVFASRGVQRPNKLGLTLVDLVSVKGNIVTVRGLIAFDGSPFYTGENEPGTQVCRRLNTRRCYEQGRSIAHTRERAFIVGRLLGHRSDLNGKSS
ncbi:MAG: SAM-dependent methyltransferase [Candidatus Thermoplasmatota archaeon]|nr:SAM-dependent methyltransferase [Candidatus Thermoplasmatota archaeon]MBU1914076.1 SAM-dependent methyltransferase [Candidatus Thermoplasmatota archaeon]